MSNPLPIIWLGSFCFVAESSGSFYLKKKTLFRTAIMAAKESEFTQFIASRAEECDYFQCLL